MKFIVNNKKTNKVHEITAKDENVSRLKRKPTQEEHIDDAGKKDKVELSEEDIVALKELVALVPDIKALLAGPSGSADEEEEEEVEEEEEEEVVEDEGAKESSEEHEEDVVMEEDEEEDIDEDEEEDEEVIEDECGDDVHDSETSIGSIEGVNDSKVDNTLNHEVDVADSFSERYSKFLKK